MHVWYAAELMQKEGSKHAQKEHFAKAVALNLFHFMVLPPSTSPADHLDNYNASLTLRSKKADLAGCQSNNDKSVAVHTRVTFEWLIRNLKDALHRAPEMP